MRSRDNTSIPTEEIEGYLENFISQHSELISSWVAELQDRLMRPETRVSISKPDKHGKTETFTKEYLDGELDYCIRFNDYIPISVIKILNILSWFFTDEGLLKSLIQISTDECYKRRQLYNHIDLMIYMHSKPVTLLYLTYVSQMSASALHGRLGELVKYIDSDVKNSHNLKRYFIFPTSFWYKVSSQPVQKYSGWRRHQNDHGSLRSDNYHFTNIIEDEEFQRSVLVHREEREKLTLDSIELTFGYLM